jgi:hypothetical protein
MNRTLTKYGATICALSSMYLFQAPHTFQMVIGDQFWIGKLSTLDLYSNVGRLEQHRFGWDMERIDEVEVSMGGHKQEYYWLVYRVIDKESEECLRKNCEGDQ